MHWRRVEGPRHGQPCGREHLLAVAVLRVALASECSRRTMHENQLVPRSGQQNNDVTTFRLASVVIPVWMASQLSRGIFCLGACMLRRQNASAYIPPPECPYSVFRSIKLSEPHP